MLLAGCASAPVAPVVPSEAPRPAADAGIPADALETQRLYRVRYEGPGGAGGLRLVLRLAAPDRFSIAASDTFGRAVWSLELARGETLLVDHRQKSYCSTGADVRVPEAALAPLPIEMLPGVLLGELPVAPNAEPDDDALDWVDEVGRRWTARLEGGEPSSWTLWDEGAPSLWWQAQGERGGVLSHRGGSQFRWRESGVEPLAAGGEALEPPAGYSLSNCDDWGLPQPREDQPASAGDRSPE